MTDPEDHAAQKDVGPPESKDPESPSPSEEQRTPLEEALEHFLHRAMDIEDCARQYITAANRDYRDSTKTLKSDVVDLTNLIQDQPTKESKAAIVKRLLATMREAKRLKGSSPGRTIERGLFIYLFAAFDKFVGDMILALYEANPVLYRNLNREIRLSEALQFDSIEDLRRAVLDKEIENLRRKSYSEQFKDMESRFSITLTKFDAWPTFIESSQRRNLFTHCDGVVSKQYLDACAEAGFKFKEPRSIGEQLSIGPDYFFAVCMVVTQVAVMLTQTLWRKTAPDEIEKADNHLTNLIFEFLQAEHWRNAISLSQFAVKLPRISSNQMERIFAINYGIALKAIGKPDACKNMLAKMDWSAASYDFKLAHAVLCDHLEDARSLMLRIGKKGELVSEFAYHDWPLFRDFRSTENFFSTYAEIYGYDFVAKLSSLASEAENQVEAETHDANNCNSADALPQPSLPLRLQ